MDNRKKGIIMISLGIAGSIFTSIYDLLVGRGRISFGPISVFVLVICAGLIIIGIFSLLKNR